MKTDTGPQGRGLRRQHVMKRQYLNLELGDSIPWHMPRPCCLLAVSLSGPPMLSFKMASVGSPDCSSRLGSCQACHLHPYEVGKVFSFLCHSLLIPGICEKETDKIILPR